MTSFDKQTTDAAVVPERADVAFSFLATDQPLAERLSDFIKRQVSVFVFSEQQKEIAGKDGVEVFTHLYGETAQFVVVLYRKDYGTTRWTRIEQTAITSRAVDAGWSSIFLISLDGTKPKWLPASRLFYGIEQFGEREAADAILDRFGELGLTPSPETINEYSTRVAREVEEAEYAKQWRGSALGVKGGTEELGKLRQYVEQAVAAMPDVLTARFLVENETPLAIRVELPKARTSFVWIRAWPNSLEQSELQITEYEFHWSRREFISQPVRQLGKSSAELFLDPSSRTPIWLLDDKVDRSYSTEALADHFLRRLLERRDGREVGSK